MHLYIQLYLLYKLLIFRKLFVLISNKFNFISFVIQCHHISLLCVKKINRFDYFLSFKII